MNNVKLNELGLDINGLTVKIKEQEENLTSFTFKFGVEYEEKEEEVNKDYPSSCVGSDIFTLTLSDKCDKISGEYEGVYCVTENTNLEKELPKIREWQEKVKQICFNGKDRIDIRNRILSENKDKLESLKSEYKCELEQQRINQLIYSLETLGYNVTKRED